MVIFPNYRIRRTVGFSVLALGLLFPIHRVCHTLVSITGSELISHNFISKHNTLIELLEKIGACNSDYRYIAPELHDDVNELLAIGILRKPAVGVVHDVPPLVPNTTESLCLEGAFTGHAVLNKGDEKGLPLFTAFMFSHEVELLEARLYEGLGIVDKHFVAESRFTHRGHRKPMFASELVKAGGRLEHFADVIHIVDLDNKEVCPNYVTSVMRNRNHTQTGPVWEIQDNAQDCLATFVSEFSAQYVPDALVHVADLDEMPFRSLLASIRLCEMKGPFPVPCATTLWGNGKLCHSPTRRQVHGLIFRASNMTGQRRPGDTSLRGQSHTVSGGVHLTYFGGSLMEYFKTSNHAEGGILSPLGWLNTTHNPSICDSTRQDWLNREILLCTDWEVIWRKNEKVSPSRSARPPVMVEEKYMPWVIGRNKDRYPCFFDNSEACLQSYIDIIMQ